MSRSKEDRQALSVLMDIQDGLFQLRQDLLLIIAARSGVSSWEPTEKESVEDEVGTLTLLLDAYLDKDPRRQIKELIEMTEIITVRERLLAE